MARYFGKVLDNVKIFPAPGCMPNEGKTITTSRPLQHLRAEDEAVICLAGFAVEHCYNPEAVSWEDFWNGDGNKYASDRANVAAVIQRCLEHTATEDDNDHVLDGPVKIQLARATDLITKPRHWRAINALADRLCVAPFQITGEDADYLIEAILQLGG